MILGILGGKEGRIQNSEFGINTSEKSSAVAGERKYSFPFQVLLIIGIFGKPDVLLKAFPSRCNQSSMAEVYVIPHLRWGKQCTDEHKHETQWPSVLCQRIPRKLLSWHRNYQYTSQVSLSPSEHKESSPFDDPSSKSRFFWDSKHQTPLFLWRPFSTLL